FSYVICMFVFFFFFFFSSRRRHTRSKRDWSSDVCSSDLRVRPQWTLSAAGARRRRAGRRPFRAVLGEALASIVRAPSRPIASPRSEERRVGKECRARWWPYDGKKKKGSKTVMIEKTIYGK